MYQVSPMNWILIFFSMNFLLVYFYKILFFFEKKSFSLITFKKI
uniref:ATP synthase F0 subunit 8 n=1 Tax=Tetranychus ludeni TaxID=182134 RepID=A0A075X883_TETLU|nr:ATP synthase F0 subunit 8 [Tetranychus ludeni]AIH15657.1 ATP synthase F0 subunit 8 [Tetranychus ludeni]